MLSETAPQTNLRYLKGVGPKRALALEKLGISSVRDLLYFFPRRYEDRRNFRTIDSLVLHETATLRGEILKVQLKPIRRMFIFELLVGDDTGTVAAVWFNQPYLKKQFEVGQRVILYGKVEFYQNRLQITSPEYEILDEDEETVHTGRITPVYPLTEGLFQRSLRSTLKETIDTQVERIITEHLPASFLEEKNLMGLPQAIREMHFPSEFDLFEKARRRIVFDEFLVFELILLKKMELIKLKYQSYALEKAGECRAAFEASLPFQLTAGQKKAINELSHDLSQTIPMNRLLQGDVGSGKTVAAAFALLLAAQSGKQGVLLVPTEILADQHYQTLVRFLKPLGVNVGLLTASTPAPRRERMLAELRQGKLQVLTGTHAVLQEDVQFKSLALVVTDEQHKFGVYQRSQLLNVHPRPHQLVMTATPIPRTLALTIYGNLEISVLRELPAGRQPIQTYWVTRAKQGRVLEHILEKINKGEQAYFIFPLIEETEKSDLLAAKKEFENLKKTVFSGVPMGLVHGRQEKGERDLVMQGFRSGEIKVIVATSVIEVGVDHPNATMMVIENAERFGLSQLHQMRGRIGRGSLASECFLFGEPKTDEGKKRLRIMTKTQDGFVIAEEDLKLRGPGDFLGKRQSGEPLFRIANPLLDEPVLLEARETAKHLLRTKALENAAEWQGMKSFLDQMALHY